MLSRRDLVSKYKSLLIENINKIESKNVIEIMSLLEKTAKEKKTIYVFGNGGSSTTALHMQNDFNIGVSRNVDYGYRFVCLSDNIPTITAIANDYSYNDIFRKQLEKRLDTGDIIIAISCSGNSENIIKAVEYAKSLGNVVIGITGYDGGKLQKISNYNFHIDVNNMQIVEDLVLILNHMMMFVFKMENRDINA